MAGTPNVCRYIDMPIQHASDRTLAQMGRKTKLAHIRERLAAIRRAMPDITVRTTFIVGFPGEREEDFARLMEFAREEPFDHVGAFPYSDEDGTTAAKMPDKVPARTIASRLRTFTRQQSALHVQRLGRWIGRELTVLVDAQRDFGAFACRHAGQAHGVDNVTLVEDDRLEVGAWARVRVTGVRGVDLVAEMA
jgi:ribosomal protein S12 methylthiotransferase